MKSIGIVRRVDELGRIVLPVELRRTLGIEVKDSLEIFVDEEGIVLRKYAPGCIFCGETDDVAELSGKPVCSACVRRIADVLK